MRSFLVACALGVVVGAPAPVDGSGSVAVTVASKRHSLTVTQTFRKILAAKDAESYYDEVRGRFIKICTRLTPRLDRQLDQTSRYVPALGLWSAPLRTIECSKTKAGEPAVPEGGKYPALVELPPIQVKGNDRLAYVVRLPFRRRPGKRALSWLHKKSRAIIQAHAENQSSPAGPKAVKLKPALEKSKRVKVTLTSQLYFEPKQAARIRVQLKVLARKLRVALEAQLARASGLTLTDVSDKLPYHEENKKLPGLASAHHWGRRFHIAAVYALETVTDEEAPERLRRDLRGVIGKVLGHGR
jgi:hypothetical protein